MRPIACALAVSLFACTTTLQIEPDITIGRCTLIEGKTFTSVDVQPDCGLGPTGPVPCNWSIVIGTDTATTSRIEWHYSDIQQTDAIQCQDTHVATPDGHSMGSYDAATPILT